MGERYFEVDIEEELEKEYVKECMFYINTKVVEAIQCLSRQTGGQLHFFFMATIECVNFADYKNCTLTI